MRLALILLIPVLLFGQFRAYDNYSNFLTKGYASTVDPYLIVDWTYASGITTDGSNYVTEWASAQGINLEQSGSTTKPLWVVADSMITFDGSNDYLQTSGATSTMDLGSGSFSFAWWFYSTNYNQGKKMFGKLESSSETYYLQVQFQSILFYAFEGGVETIRAYPSSAALINSVHHHVAMTCDRNTVQFYIDGQPVTTTTAKCDAVPLINTAEFRLGTWGGTYFNGKVGRFTFWRRELTASEVQEHFEETR